MIGGSKTTVLAHLQALRDDRPAASEVPATVLGLARDALVEVYRAGRAAEAETVRTATEHMSAAMRDQDAQIEELAERAVQLEEENARLLDRLGASAADRADLIDRIAVLEAEVGPLVGELAVERTKGEAGLFDALSRMEGMLKVVVQSGGTRGTLSLPAGKRPHRDSG